MDLLGTAAVNAQMVMELARVYGIELAKEQARELAVSVGRTLAGLGVIKSAVTVIGTALSLSLPTMLAGRAIQAVAAAWLTRVAGASFIRYFEQDQDWGDGGMQDVLQEQFDLNRRDASLKRFLAMAMRQVVEPLQQMKTQRCRLGQSLRRRGAHRAAGVENRDHQEINKTDRDGNRSCQDRDPARSL